MNYAIAVILFGTMLLIMLLIGHAQKECDGTLVRGAFGYTCIEGDR